MPMDRTPVESQPKGLMMQVEAFFLRYLRVERRLSPVTITNYHRQLSVIVEMLTSLKITEWQKVDTAIVRNIAAKSRKSVPTGCKYGFTIIVIEKFFGLDGASRGVACKPSQSNSSTQIQKTSS